MKVIVTELLSTEDSKMDVFWLWGNQAKLRWTVKHQRAFQVFQLETKILSVSFQDSNPSWRSPRTIPCVVLLYTLENLQSNHFERDSITTWLLLQDIRLFCFLSLRFPLGVCAACFFSMDLVIQFQYDCLLLWVCYI